MPSYVACCLGAALMLFGLGALVLVRHSARLDEEQENASQSCDCEKCDGHTDFFHHDDLGVTDDERKAEIEWMTQWIS